MTASRVSMPSTGWPLWLAAAHLLRETGNASWRQVDARDVQRWTVRLLGRYGDA